MNEEYDAEFDFTGDERPENVGKIVGVRPGKYHAMIMKVEKGKKGEHPTLKLTFKILAGTVPAEKGKVHFEDIFLTDNESSKARQKLFAFRLGLFSADILGQKGKANWLGLDRKNCVIDIISEEFMGRNGQKQTGSKISQFGVWDYMDLAVADVPKNLNVLADLGLPMPPAAPPPPDTPPPFSDVAGEGM